MLMPVCSSLLDTNSKYHGVCGPMLLRGATNCYDVSDTSHSTTQVCDLALLANFAGQCVDPLVPPKTVRVDSNRPLCTASDPEAET